MKEENFEMSVLNAVNGNNVDELYDIVKPFIEIQLKAKKVNQNQHAVDEVIVFMENRKTEKVYGGDDDDGIVDDEPNDIEGDDGYESVCSENTEDMNLDDDDDDVDITDVLNYKAFME